MLCEGLEQLLVAEELFQHLRRHLDEVALRRKAGEPRPLRVPAENGVHQVAELVKVSHDIGVLQQARIALVAPGEVADQRGLGQVAPAHAGNDRRGGEPLVLALARMHIEIETADDLAAFEHVEDRNRRIPGRRRRTPELDLEQPRRSLQHARLDLRVRKIGPHRLRIEIELRAPKLLVPVAAAGDVDLLEPGCRPRANSRIISCSRRAPSRLASFSFARNVRTLAAEPIIWSAVARSAQLRKPSTVAISCRVASSCSSSICWFAG